jgi:ribonuclease Z
MLPKMPPRSGQNGFLYIPPYRVQGVSIAGEQTMVQVPELDVAFDIGLCPRIALASPYVALSHGHMDHIAGLPYYFSQRLFQGMGVGTCVCHPKIADAIETMMQSWVALEQQQTQHTIVPLGHGEQIEVKNNIVLRAIEMHHTVPANGYVLVEQRSKLREEFHGLPQEELRRIKANGTEITHILEIPLVAYTGDTFLNPNLFCDEFVNAQIVISECTFIEPGHRDRAAVGKHLHVEDLAALLDVWQAPEVVLVHLSRRTNMMEARDLLAKGLGDERAQRVLLLMDHRNNRNRYEGQQVALNA